MIQCGFSSGESTTCGFDMGVISWKTGAKSLDSFGWFVIFGKERRAGQTMIDILTQTFVLCYEIHL